MGCKPTLIDDKIIEFSEENSGLCTSTHSWLFNPEHSDWQNKEIIIDSVKVACFKGCDETCSLFGNGCVGRAK